MSPVDFSAYLRSRLTPASEDWGSCYTPTEAKLLLKVQTVNARQDDPTQRQPESPKRYEVLAGLREYAHHHVLLVGKPGSGKSTALKRLLWEEARTDLEKVELFSMKI
jgi:predicted NACHT family NTPase